MSCVPLQMSSTIIAWILKNKINLTDKGTLGITREGNMSKIGMRIDQASCDVLFACCRALTCPLWGNACCWYEGFFPRSGCGLEGEWGQKPLALMLPSAACRIRVVLRLWEVSLFADLWYCGVKFQPGSVSARCSLLTACYLPGFFLHPETTRCLPLPSTDIRDQL